MTTTPFTHSDLYTSVYIGGLKSPGTVMLSGYEREQDWDDQKAKGTTGATTVHHGPKNGGFTAAFYLADFEDCEAWDVFHDMLDASTGGGGKPKALPAYHPDLVRNKILDVVVKSIGVMAYDGKGGATVTCKFIEYKPPKPKPAVKAGAAGKRTGTTTVNDPNAQRKAELAALVAQAKLP